MQLTFLSLIYIIAFSHALMMAAALWNRSEKGHASRLLAVMILVFAYKLFEGGVTYSNLYQWIPHVLDWLPGAVLILGPLYYGYIRKIFHSRPLSKGQWLLHFIPAILLILYNSPTVFVSGQQKIDNVNAFLAFDGTINLPLFIICLLIGIKIHLGLYLYRSWSLLRRYGDNVGEIRADESARVLHRHKQLCVAFVLLETLWVVLFLLQQFTPLVALDYVSKIWLLFMSVIILTMGYYGLKLPDLFFASQELQLIDGQMEQTTAQKESHPSKVKLVSGDASDTREKYVQSSIDNETAEQIAKLIEGYFVEQKGHLNDKLTLTELAQAIELKPHLVSQVINQHMQASFYKLVNRYRIEQAIEFLSDETLSWSLERIGLESGFANRVTFNNAFKSLKGCSPSQFRKRAKLAG